MNLRRGGAWVDVMVVGTVVAVGIVVAGVTNNPQPDIDAIPGCDVVIPAGEGFSFTIGSYQGTYDNPDYPWLTSVKASAMSDALVESLPADMELEYAAPSNSLVFQPMNIYPGNGEIAEGITVEDISGDSTASGVVARGGVEADLRVSVAEADGAIPPCIEGRVGERTTLPDGTVIDTLDAVSEYDGVSTHRRTASAYFADTIVSARTSNEGSDAALPLEIAELRSIVSNPELRASAPIPDGTPPPRRDCGSSRENPGPPLTRDVVERLGAALSRQWAMSLPEARSDRSVGDLIPGSYGSGSACNRINVLTPSGAAELTVEISVAENTGWSDDEPPDSPGVRRTVLPDGSVVTSRPAEASSGEYPIEFVSVLRPSNTFVQFSFDSGIDVDALIEVASAPGLDL